MLQENLKALRISRGITQEEMAGRLHVVRQTISKWEKGLSVPDAEMLSRIAELFEVPMSQLLGEAIEPDNNRKLTAEQFTKISKKSSNERSRGGYMKTVLQIIVAIILAILIFIIGMIVFSTVDTSKGNITITESTEIIEQ